MEEYDVLGNFKDLKSIFKNIPNAVQLQPPCPILEDSLNDSDILKEFEKSLPKNKMKPKAEKDSATKSKLDTDIPSLADASPKKQEAIAVKTDLVIQNEGVAYRTRRSLRSSREIENANNTDSSIDKNSNSGKKSRRSQTKKFNNAAPTTSGTANSSITTAVTGGRGGKKTARGRARKNNANNSLSTLRGHTVLSTIEVSSTAVLSDNAQRANQTRDVMRARRNFIAEHAARCPTVDVVDLVASPMPRVEGFINLDDDDDDEHKKQNSKITTSKQPSLDFSFDEDNPEMSIKINWQSKIQAFKLRKYQKFATIFEQLAKLEKVEVDQIFLNLNNQIVKPDDTPATINYKIYQFIEGRAMNCEQFGGVGVTQKKKRDPNVIKLKVQSDKFKKALHIDMNKTENFRKLIIKCSEELQIPYDNITKLCFDGEKIELNQTPVDLELEGGEIIEIHLK